MGFGNPYGDPYDEEIVFEWVNKLVAMDIGIISLADTVGLATPAQVYDISGYLVESLPGTEIGVHLHSTPDNWKEKLEAAVKSGCKRFDGALMIDYFEQNNLLIGLNKEALSESLRIAEEIFI